MCWICVKRIFTQFPKESFLFMMTYFPRSSYRCIIMYPHRNTIQYNIFITKKFVLYTHTSLNAAFYIKRSTERKRISYSQACNVSPFFSENRNVSAFFCIIKKYCHKIEPLDQKLSKILPTNNKMKKNQIV